MRRWRHSFAKGRAPAPLAARPAFWHAGLCLCYAARRVVCLGNALGCVCLSDPGLASPCHLELLPAAPRVSYVAPSKAPGRRQTHGASRVSAVHAPPFQGACASPRRRHRRLRAKCRAAASKRWQCELPTRNGFLVEFNLLTGRHHTAPPSRAALPTVDPSLLHLSAGERTRLPAPQARPCCRAPSKSAA